MAKSYSDELRQQVIAFINEGNTVRQAAEKFSVSPSFAAKVHKKHADQPEAPLFSTDIVPEAEEDTVDDGSVTALDLADMIGVSKRSISDYTERGIIVKTGRNRYDLRKSVQLYCEHIRAMAAGRGGDNVDALATERARLASEQANHTAMKNAIMRREMIPAAEVRSEWVSIARRVRSAFMSLPSRCRQKLGHLTTYDVDVIDSEVRAALVELGEKDNGDSVDDIATSSMGGIYATTEAAPVGMD